jgi:hypothetical protein
VTSLTRTKTHEVCNRITEIYHRWQSAEKYLSPTIDFLPQLLIVSILLFVAGLIDNLFSISASLDGAASRFLFTASGVCSVVFGIVVFILACTIVHGIFQPLNSPFTSTLTNLIIKGYMHCLAVLHRQLAALRSVFGVDLLWDVTYGMRMMASPIASSIYKQMDTWMSQRSSPITSQHITTSCPKHTTTTCWMMPPLP